MPLLSPPHLLDGARWKARRIGLLGGSFNPPHKGHVHISLAALRAFKLDCIWWLVTPQNPLKALKPLKLEQRLQLCKDLTQHHPNIAITALEQDLGTHITYDSIRALKSRFPHTQFIWITGMDNAHSLHTWNNWRDLLQEISMVHITRPPAYELVKQCPVRLQCTQQHIQINTPAYYDLSPGITYWMMHTKLMNISSTDLRQKMDKTVKTGYN
jgi:nicotinate-nucleotide adenylyltransferase